jgi:hypothetical protein
MLVAEGKPQAGMPGRRTDHRQAVRQRRPRASPCFADGIAEFGHAARQRNHLIELGERGRRIAAGQLDARGDTDALLHRGHDETAVDVIDRTPQRTRRIRLEFAMVATLEGERNAIAERPQNFRGPRSQRDHDMARRNLTTSQHNAPTIAVGHDRPNVRLPDIAAGTYEHPRIGLDDGAR